MQDLPAFFRALAEVCEANGGKLPDLQQQVSTQKPKKSRKKVGVTGNPIAVRHAKRILYGT